MIAQYPWASVKAKERQHLELGAIITLSLMIVAFYTVPEFETVPTTTPVWTPPPIDVVSIPATQPPPERVAPLRPSIPIGVDDMPMDELPPEIGDLDFKKYTGLGEAPPKPELPVYDFLSVEEQPIPVGGWAELGKNIVYPEIAQEAGITGKVLVYAVIDEQGRVIETSILSGIPNTGLDEAAMEAVRKTAFVPAYQRDKPVRVSIKIPITFSLK